PLPYTTILHHAPGWTLFRDVYMSNGTLLILTPDRDTPNHLDFIKRIPEFRMVTSTGLPASPGNEAEREPTERDMAFITSKDAQENWGTLKTNGKGETKLIGHRVLSVSGSTLLPNDPPQFLKHYYHLVAELFLGVQAFWYGTFAGNATPLSVQDYKPFSDSPSSNSFVLRQQSGSEGWRDVLGFNAFFLRTTFPEMAIEGEEDWVDRVRATSGSSGAHHIPLLLLTDRSAAFRETMCGSRSQRTASEAWEYMRGRGLLAKSEEGKEKMEVRERIWTVAGFRKGVAASDVVQVHGIAGQGHKGIDAEGSRALALVNKAWKRLVRRQWEFVFMELEKIGRDEQIRVAAKTDILVSIHGNGLSHLVFMQPSPVATVIGIFYPGGYAHDYSWTTRALGMEWWGIWKDESFTHPHKPWVEYPEGFHGEDIPVNGDTAAKLVERRIDDKI
ncbi:hypothetical protein K435DRAFT_686234, partial [Dendrothele bispora CBS 962.96]